MSVTSDLQSLVKLLRQKERQTLDAARQRLEALQRISSDFATLKKIPSDGDAKSRLSRDLETEKGYLKTIQDRSRDISKLLDVALIEIKNIRKSNKTNQKITGDLDALNSVFNEFKIILKYILGKIDLIKNRVKTGDRLLKGKLNEGDILFAELTELYNEKQADGQIIKVLSGGPGIKARTKWQEVKNMLALDIKPREGRIVGTLSNINPNELPEELKLFAEIIVLIFSFFRIFANYEFSSEQQES